MKLNVSNELKSRLTHAAENGSVIAKDILSDIKTIEMTIFALYL